MNDLPNYHFFAATYQGIIPLLQDAVTGIIAVLLPYARGLLIAAAGAWLAGQAIAYAFKIVHINTLITGLFRIALAATLLGSVGAYTQYIAGLTQLIPHEIGDVIAGSLPNANVAGISDGGAFDTLFNAMLRSDLATLSLIPDYSLKSIPLTMLTLAIIPIGFVFIALAFLVYMGAAVVLLLLLSVGPLAVGCFAFPQSAKFATGWVSSLASAIVVQILSIVCLALLFGAEMATIARIPVDGRDANMFNGIICLVQVAGLFLIVAIIAWIEIPKIAGSISHATSHGMGLASGAVWASGKAANKVADVARSGSGSGNRPSQGSGSGGGGGNTAPRPAVRVTGKSLS